MPSKFRVSPADEGVTLSAFLKRQLPELAWSRARALCERGKVSVDGEVILDPVARLSRGAEVILDEKAKRPPPNLPGRIAFEDAHVVVLDKPSGVNSVPYEKRESGTAMDLIRDFWRAQGKKATTTPRQVVHRI
jgi:23S rRNA pseudouridine1911/1915/1917 synthase